MPEEKLRLNKTELKSEKDQLRQRLEFLPVLELKKQQLQIVVDSITPQIAERIHAINETMSELQSWQELLAEDPGFPLERLYDVARVATGTENIAGVDVPTFEDVSFTEFRYDLFTTPPWVDAALATLRRLAYLREEVRILKRRRELLAEELRQTTIRVNLFEKILIPQHRSNIKRIRIYLADQEVAAISIAKIAKAKLMAGGRKAEGG